jgi:hypothetical protein
MRTGARGTMRQLSTITPRFAPNIETGVGSVDVLYLVLQDNA